MENLDVYSLIIKALAIMVGFTIHEAAHAYTAFRLGDLSQKSEGRLTLNPIKHLDPIGFIMLLLFNFGWAKPVRFNPEYFKKLERDMILVALAGPISNFLGAIISFGLLKILSLPVVPDNIVISTLSIFLLFSAKMNVVLFIFNLIPLPPLDGAAVLLHAIPANRIQWRIAAVQFGPMILIALILLDSFSGMNFLSTIINNMMMVFLKIFQF